MQPPSIHLIVSWDLSFGFWVGMGKRWISDRHLYHTGAAWHHSRTALVCLHQWLRICLPPVVYKNVPTSNVSSGGGFCCWWWLKNHLSWRVQMDKLVSCGFSIWDMLQEMKLMVKVSFFRFVCFLGSSFLCKLEFSFKGMVNVGFPPGLENLKIWADLFQSGKIAILAKFWKSLGRN